MGFGDSVTQFEHQPIGGGMQNKPHLIGKRRTTGSAVRRQLALVQFDQIFHLSARAIERVVDMFGRAIDDVGDDVADIQPQFRCFDASADATLDFPGFGGVVRLRVAAQDRCLFQRATGADVVGLVFDSGGEKLVAGQSENVIEIVVLAPIHHLAASIMAIASDGDLGCRPVHADAPDDPAQMAAHFLAGRRLAGTQNDCDGTPSGGVVNMDRKEAALIIMRIEQRQLLMTMRDIAGVVDIERDGLRRRGVTGAIKIDEDAAQFHDFAQGRRVLPTRHGRLRA